MTVQELRSHFVNTFGYKPWPETFEVDHETYANVCKSVFEWAWKERQLFNVKGGGKTVEFHLGPNKSIMFKGVELILKG